MRLWELFEDISPLDIQRIEYALDKFVYQPTDKVKKREPVLDVDLPTASSSHFMQRLNLRGDKAQITPAQIYSLLKQARENDSLGFAKKLDKLSKENDPGETITLVDKDGLTIPVIIRQDPTCVKTQNGNPVCVNNRGTTQPKNKMVAKTIFRKGVED